MSGREHVYVGEFISYLEEPSGCSHVDFLCLLCLGLFFPLLWRVLRKGLAKGLSLGLVAKGLGKSPSWTILSLKTEGELQWAGLSMGHTS